VIFRGIAMGLLLVTVLLLQTVVAPHMEIAGIAPNLVVLSVVSVGMMTGTGLGLRYGFLAGLSVDLLTGSEAILGVSALLLLLAGYVAGQARPFIAASQVPGQVVVAGVGLALVTMVGELLEFLLGRDIAPVGSLVLEALAGGVYAAVLAPLACVLVGRLDRIRPANT
jgi:rod shape-determining protein MreD